MRPARPRHTPARRAFAVGVAAAVVACGVTAAAATAGAAPLIPAGAQNVTEVTVFLQAPHPQALAALAGANGLTRAERLRRLATLVPSASTHAEVTKALAEQGLTVVGQTAWSLTAHGSAAHVASAFGTRPKASTSNHRAATAALPALPSALAEHVSAVFPTTAGPAVLHHMTTSTLDGTDFRNADTPAGVTPSTGMNSSGTTVATVQFADFNHNGTSNAAASTTAADLTSYADEHDLTDPVASGQYQAVRIDGGPSATDDKQGGDVEVDLDQEAILSTAPTADQHPYFAPNTAAGFGDVFGAVYDDVVGNQFATAADPNITALSSSWGECESDTGASAIEAVEPALESLAAAGVTVFSAAGDDGIYDCGSTTGTGLDNSQADVDFPGSSPVVVSVGGTNLSAAKSAPNTGTNWKESAWTCTSAVSCQNATTGTGGSGGGASGSAYSSSTSDSFAGFAAPAYQTATVHDTPFAGAKTRLVPDIAADGDPSTGFVVYSSEPKLVLEAGSNNVTIGGTSLATPISAAQFDNALADTGIKTGVGDIHDALYSAYSATGSLAATSAAKVFRDVTTGTNGAAANEGSDPSVSAQAGYDTVSGLGGVLWSALIPYLTASGSPTASGTLTEPDATKTSGTYTVDGTWTAAPGGDKRALTGTAVSVRAVNGNVVYSATSSATSGSFTFAGKPGRTYDLAVTPTDLAGKSTTGTAKLVTPIDNTAFTLSQGWTSSPSGTDFGGTHIAGTAKTLTAKVAAEGRHYSVRVIQGPRAGKLGVYLSGKLVTTVDTYAAKTVHKLLPFYSSSTSATRTFTFKPLGTKNAKSKGTAVTLDDVVVTY